MTKFFLITGFLGSGKTTFLKNVLHSWGCKHRIVVIQNEFASSGVDGKELKLASPDFKLVEINNGSVFCVCLLSNFISSLDKILTEYQPEYIFLESSGLADPINIAELLQAEELKNRVSLAQIITLADAPHIDKSLNLLTRTRHQIMIADRVLLNKTDIYEGNIEKLKQRLTELNSFARIIATSYGKMAIEELEESYTHEASEQYRGRESEGSPEEIKTCVLRTHEKISPCALKAFLEEISPQCVRIKGFIHTTDDKAACFHAIFDSIEVRTLDDYNGATEIIAFSESLNAKELRKILKTYVEQ